MHAPTAATWGCGVIQPPLGRVLSLHAARAGRSTGDAAITRIALSPAPALLATAAFVHPQLEMRKLEDRIDAIHREMMYQREREETHRDTNESTNSRVVWYSLMTILAVLGVSLAQAWSMRSYLLDRGILEGSSKRSKASSSQASWMSGGGGF